MIQKKEIIKNTRTKIASVTLLLVLQCLPLVSAAQQHTNGAETERLNAIWAKMKKKYAQFSPKPLENPQSNDSQIYEPEPSAPTSTGTDNPIPTVTVPANSRFSEGEELLLSLSLDNYFLSEIFVYKSKTGFQVPLEDFVQVLDLAITVEAERLSASGWVTNQKNVFTLSPSADNNIDVTVAGKQYQIDTNHYQVMDGQLYVELEDLSKWLEFRYHVQESKLALELESIEPFPITLRMARQNAGDLTQDRSQSSVLPLQDSGYQLFSPPLLDMQLSARKTDTSNSASYSVLSAHDLGYFSNQLFIAGNDDKLLNAAHMTLSRQSAKPELLGPLNAREYQFGDVTPVNVGTSVTRAQSLGFSATNAGADQLLDNSRVNLTGDIQVGWDVELYRNAVLIERKVAIDTGRYEFNDISLSYGKNDFELVFYGPQGQIETQQKSIFVDENAVSAREGIYQFSLVDLNNNLFNVNEAVTDPTQKGLMFSGSYDYGFTDWFSLGLGTSYFSPKQGEDESILALRTNLTLPGIGLYNGTIQFDNDNKNSMRHSFRTVLGTTALDLGYNRAESIVGVEKSNTDSYYAKMSGRLFANSSLPISYENSWNKYQSSTGNANQRLQNNLGFNSRYGSLSHALIWQETKNAGTDSRERLVTGSLQYRKNIGRTFTRFFAGYGIKPEAELQSLGISLIHPWTSDLNSELRYSRVIQSDTDQAAISVNWRQELFTLSTNAIYNSDDSWSLSMSLRFGLGYDQLDNSIFAANRPIAQQGAVSARVFEDLNQDNVFNEGEPVLEGVKVKAAQAYRDAQTNEAGVALITAIPINKVTDIVIDTTTLQDPFLMSSGPGTAIASRRGFIHQVDIPVVKAGELEGVIYLKDDFGNENPAQLVRLNLLDKNGRQVASVRSEYDGYYLFANVVPGTYRIEVDAGKTERDSLKKPKAKQVKFSNQGDIISGVDFVLAPLESASGYVASAGQFHSPALLKLYYQLLKKRLPAPSTEQQAFYIKSKDSKQYVLGLAYFEGDRNAANQTAQFCTALKQQNIPCTVEYHNFAY